MVGVFEFLFCFLPTLKAVTAYFCGLPRSDKFDYVTVLLGLSNLMKFLYNWKRSQPEREKEKNELSGVPEYPALNPSSVYSGSTDTWYIKKFMTSSTAPLIKVRRNV